jgi:hypothetical protein
MIKQVIGLVVLSIVIILGLPYIHQGLELILAAHNWIAQLLLKNVFAGSEIGNVIGQLIALLTIPFAVALVPALIFWLLKRMWFPYFMEMVWIIWLIQTAAIVILHKSSIIT